MTEKTNIFERASRAVLRFPSAKGLLTVEQLWELPLTSERGPSLDAIGQDIIRQLRLMGEESLVDTGKKSEARESWELGLEIVKHMIAVKQAENAEALQRSQNRERRHKILEALAQREGAALAGKSTEELMAELEKLA